MTKKIKEVTEEVTEEVKDSTKLVPLTQEELTAISQRLESEGDFESELAKAVFTVLVIGVEYHNLFAALQAYQVATQEAFRDYAGASANSIGLRDMKKRQKLYTMAARFAAGVPERAALYIESQTEQPEEPTIQEETNE